LDKFKINIGKIGDLTIKLNKLFIKINNWVFFPIKLVFEANFTISGHLAAKRTNIVMNLRGKWWMI
jgi:hypothetical protein